MEMTNDDEIIKGLQSEGMAKRKAENSLFNQFAYFIRQGMVRHSLSEDDSFDAYSEAVLATIQAIAVGTFQGQASLKSYLFRIFHNKCVDIFRKSTTNKSSIHHTISISDMLYQMSDSAKTVVEKLMAQCDYAELEKKFGELGEACRRLLQLLKADYTLPEIRELMGYKSEAVVRTNRLRCLERLRQLYKAR